MFETHCKNGDIQIIKYLYETFKSPKDQPAGLSKLNS